MLLLSGGDAPGKKKFDHMGCCVIMWLRIV